MNKFFFTDIFIGPLTWTVDISGYCMEIGLLSTDSELAMALVRILYLLNGWNVEEIDSVLAELQ